MVKRDLSGGLGHAGHPMPFFARAACRVSLPVAGCHRRRRFAEAPQ